MTRLTLAAAAIATVMAAGTFSVATAQPAGAHHWHGGVSIHLGHGYGRIHFGHGCRRFYRRYLRTGNVYWLDRYQACRYGY